MRALLNHLVVYDDVVRRLEDLNILVVPTRKHRRTRVESQDAAVTDAAVLRAVCLGTATLFLTANLPLRIGSPLPFGRIRRQAAIRRVDDQRSAPRRDNRRPAVIPELVVGNDTAL